MEIFPLNIFPQGSLSSSVIPTVWVGMFVVCFFNLRLGWVLSGLVVPGYLVPLILIKPWAAAVVLFEGFLTYFIVWFFSEYLSRRAPWANLFGRDRFFALVLCSIVIRLYFDEYLLPRLGSWVNEEWGLNFDYRNELHSLGLIIIALIANQFWKTGFVRGLIPFFVTLCSTLLIVRYGLMEWTNFGLSNISYLYEGVAASIIASPKAYIILICTAFLASRMNLVYGWDFNGILIPSLLALQWYEPIKILATVVESCVILLVAMLLLKAPLLNKMTIEGGRKLLLFFNVSFAYKMALAYGLLTWLPAVKITDFYGFGYLLSTLIAIKIHDKGIFARLLSVTLSTSFAAVIMAGLIGFSLTLLPITKTFSSVADEMNAAVDSAPQQTLKSLLGQAQLSFYQSKVNDGFIKPTADDIALFSEALKLLQAHIKEADEDKLHQLKAYLAQLDYQLSFVDERYFYLHEVEKNRGWGVYIIDSKSQSELGLEVPAPLDEEGAFSAGVNLFESLQAKSLAIAGSYRKARADLSTDVLQNRQSFFHRFHQIINRHNSLQIRSYTTKTARLTTGKRRQQGEMDIKGLKTSLWVKSKIPADLNLPLLKKMLSSWEIKWNQSPFKSIQRDDSAYGFAELMLTKDDTHRLLFSTLTAQQVDVNLIENDVSIEGYLQDWILSRKDDIAERGSELYQIPEQGELLFFDENILTPLIKLTQNYQLAQQQWTAALLDDLKAINSAAQVMGYQLIRYHHKGSQQHYIILTENTQSPRFWGLYVFRLGQSNSYSLQVPRPLYDINSFEYGVALFEQLQAKALLIATTHPYANTDGSSDLNHPDNKVNLFNLVNQVLLRSLPKQPLLVINSRAFGYTADHGFIDADILLTFNQGYLNRQGLTPLENKLLTSLEADGLKVRLVNGSKMTLGYELGGLSQAAYLSATKHKSFALLWVSPLARANYRQQNNNLWQAAQFKALGIKTLNQELRAYVQQQTLTPAKHYQQLQKDLIRYTKTQDVFQLQGIVLQADKQGYSLTRLIDVSSRQAFLLIHDNQQRLMVIANLLPRNKTAKILPPEQLATQLIKFVNQRSFWLQIGKQ
ncbi:MAG: hypothetical protein GQ569_01710 [Methylococcaceae bacterium]|nr:hypothetical protein [Methylococcaceae bacterium]